MANVLLQLSRPSFSQIGSIEELENGSWSVPHRLLTMNINQLVSVGNLRPNTLPSTAFETAFSYFEALSNINLTHLSIQRNDAIESAEDCRHKYVARHLFRRIISEKQFPTTPVTGPKPFKLFCDDFRPSNVLVDANDKIVGVIDGSSHMRPLLSLLIALLGGYFLKLPRTGLVESWTGRRITNQN